MLFIFIERSRFDGRALSQVLIEPGLGGGNSRGRTNKREKKKKKEIKKKRATWGRGGGQKEDVG